jgi:hypothetical protein
MRSVLDFSGTGEKDGRTGMLHSRSFVAKFAGFAPNMGNRENP